MGKARRNARNMDYYKVQGQAIEDRDETAWAKKAVRLEQAAHPVADKRRRVPSVVSKKALKEERKPAPPQKQPPKPRARRTQAASRKAAAAQPREAAPKSRGAAPKSREAAPKPRGAAPKPREAAPKPREATAVTPQPPAPPAVPPPPRPAAHERPAAEQPTRAHRLARGAFRLATVVPRGLFHAAGGAVQAARSAVGRLRRESGETDEP